MMRHSLLRASSYLRRDVLFRAAGSAWPRFQKTTMPASYKVTNHTSRGYINPGAPPPTTPGDIELYEVDDDDLYDPEQIEFYRPGGYHPVMIDDLIHQRYRIVDKLNFSDRTTIWLAYDLQCERYVALKIGISTGSFVPSECNVLRKLRHSISSLCNKADDYGQISDCIPDLLEEFSIHGPNGVHPCYVTRPARDSLFASLGCVSFFSMYTARAIAARLTQAVCLLHSTGCVHGDICTRHILIGFPCFNEHTLASYRKEYGRPETLPITRSDGKALAINFPAQVVKRMELGDMAENYDSTIANNIVLTSLGQASWPALEESQRLRKSLSEICPQVTFRAPETHFEPESPVSFPSDIWSLALVIWELFAMENLFCDFSYCKHSTVADNIEVLNYDQLPYDWRKVWNREVGDDYELRHKPEYLPSRPSRDPDACQLSSRPRRSSAACQPLDQAFDERLQNFRRSFPPGFGVFDDDERQSFLDMMRSMLRFRPEDRLTAKELLKSEWMVKWALPELDPKLASSRTHPKTPPDWDRGFLLEYKGLKDD